MKLKTHWFSSIIMLIIEININYYKKENHIQIVLIKNNQK